MWHDILLNVFEDGFFAALAAIGFSSISNTPRRAYAACAIIAAAGHALRYLLTDPAIGAMHIIAASALASVAVGVLAVIFSGRIKCPAEVCFFPALLPMIPGMYAYRTVEALIACLRYSNEDVFGHYLYMLAYNGLTCAFIIICMVIGATIPVFVLKKTAFTATR